MPAPITHPVRLAALLALLSMFGPFTIDAFFPAFHAVQADLRASDWQMQQTISVYMWAYAFMSLFHGPLSDAYGRRRVILWGVVGYTLASIGCALSRSIEALLLMRVAQGICTGAGLIVGRAMVRDLFHGADAQRVMSLITVFFSIAPALAPVLGGLVYEISGWHAVFWFLALYGSGLWWLCVRVLPETHGPEARVPFRARPLFDIYRTILSDGRFVLLAIGTGFNFGAFFLYISSAPAFVEKLLGLGTLGYPWFFVPCIAGMMLGATLSSRLAGRVAPRPTVKLGYALMALATLWNLAYNFSFEQITVPWAVLPIALYTFGNSLIFPTLSLKMLDRYPANRGAASSVQGVVWGIMTGAIAGVLSAAVSGRGVTLAITSAVMLALGWSCWRIYAQLTPVEAAAPVETPLIEETAEPL
jgi:DHA1 family bicyclomycin/chloramphenicol resistance-like MFS transporter